MAQPLGLREGKESRSHSINAGTSPAPLREGHLVTANSCDIPGWLLALLFMTLKLNSRTRTWLSQGAFIWP